MPHHIGEGMGFLNRSPTAREAGQTGPKWDLVKVQKLQQSKGNCQWSEEVATEQEKTLASCTSDGESVLHTFKKHYKLSFKNANSLIKMSYGIELKIFKTRSTNG